MERRRRSHVWKVHWVVGFSRPNSSHKVGMLTEVNYPKKSMKKDAGEPPAIPCLESPLGSRL